MVSKFILIFFASNVKHKCFIFRVGGKKKKKNSREEPVNGDGSDRTSSPLQSTR